MVAKGGMEEKQARAVRRVDRGAKMCGAKELEVRRKLQTERRKKLNVRSPCALKIIDYYPLLDHTGSSGPELHTKGKRCLDILYSSECHKMVFTR